MHVFRQMPFPAFDHQPGDRQCAFAIQQTDHQRDTALPNFTAIDDEDQLPDFGQAVEQFLHKRQVIAFVPNPFILDPATVPLDPAVRFGLIRRFAGDGRQLTALAQHNPADQRRQCCQHSGRIAFRFAWIQLHDCLSNGTIHPTIVTHRYTPVLPWREKT